MSIASTGHIALQVPQRVHKFRFVKAMLSLSRLIDNYTLLNSGNEQQDFCTLDKKNQINSLDLTAPPKIKLLAEECVNLSYRY